MKDPKKELADGEKGIDHAQDALRVSITGLVTSAKDVLKLLEDYQALSRQQLSDLARGLDYLNERYDKANEDIKKVQQMAALKHGESASPNMAAATSQVLEKSTQKFAEANKTIKDIHQQVTKLPMISGKLNEKTTVDNLQKQADVLAAKTTTYYMEAEQFKQERRQGLPATPPPSKSVKPK